MIILPRKSRLMQQLRSLTNFVRFIKRMRIGLTWKQGHQQGSEGALTIAAASRVSWIFLRSKIAKFSVKQIEFWMGSRDNVCYHKLAEPYVKICTFGKAMREECNFRACWTHISIVLNHNCKSRVPQQYSFGFGATAWAKLVECAFIDRHAYFDEIM